MSPVYLNPQTSSPIPFLELKGDHTQHSFQVFGHFHHDDPNNRHNSEEILALDYSRHEKKKVGKLTLSQEKASDPGKKQSSWLQNTVGDSSCSYSYSFNFREEQKNETPVNYNDQNSSRSSNWKPSKVKVKIMQKMTGTSKTCRDGKLDHDLAKRQNCEGIRMCSDCHTTTTPLWRSGPQGPKSLCNACGIRQRKARRAAMAAAAAAEVGFGNDNAIVPTMSPPEEAPKAKVQVDQHDKSHTLPIKKRSKIFDAARSNNKNHNYTHNISNSQNAKKLFFEEFALSSNKDYLNTKRSFPRDEEEGAILLMALSCG